MDPPTNACLTTDPPTNACLTTDPPTNACLTTDPPTNACLTTDPPTNACLTTDPPTDTSITMDPPTNACLTTDPPTNASLTTDPPTETSITTDPPTNACLTTDPPTNACLTTDPPTNASLTTDPPTDTSITTDPPTNACLTADPPIETSVTMDPPTDTPITMDPPTDTSVTMDPPTDTSVTMDPPTDTSVTTDPPTDTSVTTDPPTNTSLTTDPPTESPTSCRPPTPNPRAPKYKRKRRAGEGRVKRRKSEEEERVPPGGGTEEEPPPSFPRVPFKSVLEAEAALVFEDKRDGAQRLSELAAPPLAPPAASAQIQAPPSGPNLNFLPQIDKWLHVALQDASACYRRKKYAVAAARFSAALQLCSKGAVLGRAFDADYEDISKVTSFIQSKLVTCYLRMRRPDLALTHSHRSIFLDPVHYPNHFRQAVVYRLLGRPREAARSAMVADFVLWLSGGGDQRVSGLIKRYWQAMLEQVIAREERFAAMYTPCDHAPTEEERERLLELFKKKHPAHTQYLFTDPSGTHLLPQTTDWAAPAPQRYTLTLGFCRPEDGNFLDKLLTRKCPIFTGSRAPFAPLSVEDLQRMTDSLETRILPVLDFLKCTKLARGLSGGSGVLERLQLAEYLGHLRRPTDQSLALQQALAELATAPYLQDLSAADTQLLHTLTSDSMDSLAGGWTHRERVWNEIHKVGLLEELVYEQEESFLRTRALRGGRAARGGRTQRGGRKKPQADRKPRGRKRKPQTGQPTQTPPH